jgi:hypothetical protein
MVAPFVRRIFEDLISDVPPTRDMAAAEATKFDHDDLASLLRLLSEQLQRRPSEPGGLDGLVALTEKGVESAVDTLLDILKTMAAESVNPEAAYVLSSITERYPRVKQTVVTMLERWATKSTLIGAAAPDALRDIRERASAS